MLHDARLGARRLADAGVPVEVRIWPGQLHGFQIAAGLVPEADRSLRQIAEYIREATPDYLSKVVKRRAAGSPGGELAAGVQPGAMTPGASRSGL